MTNKTLDYSGLTCPKPLKYFQEFIRNNPNFNSIKVITTDPNSIDDFEAYQEFGVISLVSIERSSEHITFNIENVR